MVSKIYKILSLAATAGLFHLFLYASNISAANFDIQPVRVELNDKVKLSKLIIKNVSDTDFPIQVHVYEWRQNEKGEDVYTETQDIITFPKIMTIAKGEERFIRLGANVPPGLKEKTYRIYVEEMPSATGEKEGANIKIYLKVGIPIFITPAKPDNKPDIESISMNGGKVQLKVKNSGNSHFIVTGINLRGVSADGMAPFSRNIGGWYLLSGSEKIYETDLPPASCNAITQLDIELKTNKSAVKKQFHVEKSMCDALIQTVSSQ